MNATVGALSTNADLVVERTRELPVHVHVRVATFYSACIGICSAVTLWGALRIPHGGAMETACIVVVAWAAGITLIALCSLRAALLAFATSLAAPFAIMLASGPVALVSAAFLLCLDAAMYRLGRIDLEQINSRTKAVTEGTAAEVTSDPRVLRAYLGLDEEAAHA